MVPDLILSSGFHLFYFWPIWTIQTRCFIVDDLMLWIKMMGLLLFCMMCIFNIISHWSIVVHKSSTHTKESTDVWGIDQMLTVWFILSRRPLSSKNHCFLKVDIIDLLKCHAISNTIALFKNVDSHQEGHKHDKMHIHKLEVR